MRPSTRIPEASVQKRRGSLAAVLTGLAVLVLAGFLWPDLLSAPAQALLAKAIPVLLILLAGSTSLSRPLLAAMAILWALLGGSWMVLIWLDRVGALSFGGIPLVLWILVFGLGILPLGVVSWAYSTTFGSDGFSADRPDRSAETASRASDAVP
jgi:hypothetical protein